MIGSDESLKGDTFGGIVVAAVRIDDEANLKVLGLTDSKKITDKKIMQLAPLIKEHYPHAIRSLLPIEYNLYKQTELLNRLHTEVAEELQTGEHMTHVVDKYPGCAVGDIAETKAEMNFVSVAAASILAREAALQQMDVLSERAGFVLPRGSTHVADGLELLKKSGKDPNEFVKMHFKNVQKVFN